MGRRVAPGAASEETARVPKRSRQPEPSAVRLPPIQCSVYMPLVHGVGAASHEEWTRKSLHRLVDWWTNAQRPVCATLIPGCPPNCVLTENHHKHLLLVGDARAARVDIETLYWADCRDALLGGLRRTRPSRRECASLALKAGSLVGLVDLAAAVVARSERLPDETDRVTARYIADMSQFAFSWLGLGVRALVTPLLALIVATACFNRHVHRALGDALAWGQNDGNRRWSSCTSATGSPNVAAPAG